ncbi:hypothetical protein DL95DRAFT_119605 [Leptodontidium sp. 2 PMI_412]|nr:hypothetical protein DL95DRAFT_119605 [Leptodontidium sp. 2 PMI_412]
MSRGHHRPSPKRSHTMSQSLPTKRRHAWSRRRSLPAKRISNATNTQVMTTSSSQRSRSRMRYPSLYLPYQPLSQIGLP